MKEKYFRTVAAFLADELFGLETDQARIKVVKSLFLQNNNTFVEEHKICTLVHEQTGIALDHREVAQVLSDQSTFYRRSVNDEKAYRLTDAEWTNLQSLNSSSNFERVIERFLEVHPFSSGAEPAKAILYRFLYRRSIENLGAFVPEEIPRSGLGQLFSEEDSFRPEERDLIRTFLDWPDSDKDRLVFQVSNLALEFALIKDNGGLRREFGDQSKIAYLDTSVLYRALGLNGLERKDRIEYLLTVCHGCGVQLKVFPHVLQEFRNSIRHHIANLERFGVQPSSSLNEIDGQSDLLEAFSLWAETKKARSYSLFRADLEIQLTGLVGRFGIVVDPELDESLSAEDRDRVESYARAIGRTKASLKRQDSYFVDTAHHPDQFDAQSVFYVERHRQENASTFLETNVFFISTDQQLQVWDQTRNKPVAVVILPSQWLSIVLRFMTPEQKDYTAFVSFINLGDSKPSIKADKLLAIVGAIQSVVESDEEQGRIFKHLAENRFRDILSYRDEEKMVSAAKRIAKDFLDKDNQEKSKRIALLEGRMASIESEAGTANQVADQKRARRAKAVEDIIAGEWKKAQRWMLVRGCLWALLCIGSLGLHILPFVFLDQQWNFIHNLFLFVDGQNSASLSGLVPLYWALAVSLTGLLGTKTSFSFSRRKRNEKKQELVERLREEWKGIL